MKLILALIIIIIALSVTLFKLLKQEKQKTNRAVSRHKRRGRLASSSRSDINQRTAPVFRSSSRDSVAENNHQDANEQLSMDHGDDEGLGVASSDDADSILGLNTQSDSSKPAPSSVESPSQPNVSAPSTDRSPSPAMPAPIITMHLKATKDRPYGGYELLQALLSNGLRFGGRQIFHYYRSSKQVEQDIVFSCASMVKPGTFDLAKMGGFSTPGLVFFLETQYADNPRKAFELLLNTIDGMVEDLGGTVFDGRLQPFCTETLMTIYRQIDQYIESCQTHDLFATDSL